jgi:hypothetical protein
LNLHVTHDGNGTYSGEISERISKSGFNDSNVMINLSIESTLKHSKISYIDTTRKAFENYVEGITKLNKIIFHPFTLSSYEFLAVVKKRFPNVKVYWCIWSYDVYGVPPIPVEYFGPYSRKYLKGEMNIFARFKAAKLGRWILNFIYIAGLKRNYIKELKASFWQIDFFCSLLPSDFLSYQKISGNYKTRHLPFAYLSLEQIMPQLDEFSCEGYKIMVGHSSSPSGNHFEVLQRLHKINPEFSVFLPLSYGDKKYADCIEREARTRFKNLEVLRQNLEKSQYYKKLKEIGWVIINVKVQQGLGNIIALIWMGVKIFLDEDSSTFKDFKTWGLIIYSIQTQLTLKELSVKLTTEQILTNKEIIKDRCNESAVSEYWQNIVT